MPLRRQDWQLIVILFLGSRIALYCMTWLGVLLYGNNDVSISAFCQFDCHWFEGIIEQGYDLTPHGHRQGDAANWAFMPVFPLISTGLSHLTGIPALSAMMLTSNLAFFICLPLFQLCLRELQLDEAAQRYGLLQLAFSPFSIYFLTGYAEALYLALMLGIFLLAYRGQWVGAGCLGMLISATRVPGVMMVFPVLMLALQRYGWRELLQPGKPALQLREHGLQLILCLWLIPLGLFAYMFYLYQLTGDALAFKHIQIAWGRQTDWPFVWWLRGFDAGGRKLYLSLMVTVGWGLNYYLFKRQRHAEATFMLICMTLPLMSSLNAIPRYLFGLYPTLLTLVLLTQRWPAARPVALALSGMGAVFVAVAFVNGKFFTV